MKDSDEKYLREVVTFSFSGISPQSQVQTKTFTYPIADVSVIGETYSGNANKTLNWKIIGSLLEMRCTFWGWSGSMGTASITLNVYLSHRSEARVEEVRPKPIRDQIYAVEFTGRRGEKFSQTISNIEGEMLSVELTGQNNRNTCELAVAMSDKNEIIISGKFSDNLTTDELTETLYLLVQFIR